MQRDELSADEIEFNKLVRAAIKLGDVDRVAALLESSPSLLNRVTVFGTWLHTAATRGKLEVVKKLVELGVDVNKPGGTFETGPLTSAVSCGHADIVRYLIENGAVMDTTDASKDPLFSAIYGGHLDIAKMLIEHGMDRSVKYSFGIWRDMDALRYAHALGQHEMVEYLLSLSDGDQVGG